MIRWEGKGMCVRYDGTETRVVVERGVEYAGLTLDELDALVDALQEAQWERLCFEIATDGA